jgi:RNA polymerase sigma-70 factor (ECF subfamily)
MSVAGEILSYRIDAFLPPVGRRTPQTPGHFSIIHPRGRQRRAAVGNKTEQTSLPWQEAGALAEDDLELLNKAGNGDSRAFHALVDRHANELFRLASSLSSSRSDAEDIVQETFLGAFRGIRKFDGRASVKTWLKRILVRQAARAWHQSRGLRKSVSLEAVDTELRPSVSTRVPSATAAVDRKIDMAAVLRTLSPEYREILVLREYEQMSYAEIALALDVPQGTVESRLHRARAELRSRLKSYNSRD